MVQAQTGIDGQPRSQVLTEVHIACYLVAIALAALLVGRVEHFVRLLRGVEGITVDVHVVDADGQTVALKQLGTLIPRDARQCVL